MLTIIMGPKAETHTFNQVKELLQNKIEKVVHNRLIVYEIERGNNISEAQGYP